MRPEDQDAFLEIVVGFAEFKGKQLSAPALELYWRSMQGWTIEDFHKAAQHLLRTCEFMPTPKDFEDLRKAARPLPAEAWQKALAHCSSGAWRNGPTGVPEIDRIADTLGGYEVIALCDLSKLGFLERRFCEHYETAQDVTDTREAVPELTADDRRLQDMAFRRLA